jgi:flagellar basal body-associated protein FliL
VDLSPSIWGPGPGPPKCTKGPNIIIIIIIIIITTTTTTTIIYKMYKMTKHNNNNNNNNNNNLWTHLKLHLESVNHQLRLIVVYND